MPVRFIMSHPHCSCFIIDLTISGSGKQLEFYQLFLDNEVHQTRGDRAGVLGIHSCHDRQEPYHDHW